jgi:hypothetical protein
VRRWRLRAVTCRGGRLLGLHRNGAVQQQLAQRPEGFLEVMDLAPLIRQLLLLLSLCGSMSLLLSAPSLHLLQLLLEASDLMPQSCNLCLCLKAFRAMRRGLVGQRVCALGAAPGDG